MFHSFDLIHHFELIKVYFPYFRNHSLGEIQAVAETIKSILNCEFNKVPIQVLTHYILSSRFPLNNVMKSQKYTKCLEEKKIIDHSMNCRSYIQTICPKIFYPDSKANFCNSVINNELDTSQIDPEIKRKFEYYKKCFENVKILASNCMPLLEEPCKSSSVRAIKTVRLGMEMVVHLLKYIPDLKIVHNLRDPRPMVLSREQINSGDMMAASAKGDIVKEAQILCNVFGRHLKLRKALEKISPGTILGNNYEDFAKHPLEKAAEIYKFLGHPLPDGVRDWLKVNALGKKDGTSKSRNASEISRAWESKITLARAKQIDRYCKHLYAE